MIERHIERLRIDARNARRDQQKESANHRVMQPHLINTIIGPAPTIAETARQAMITEDPKSGQTGTISFTFGDSEELCNELLRLVRSGQKTATCEALRNFDSEPEAMPAVGRRDIALNWDGTPALLLETLEVALTRFCDVDESFALAEGENEDLEGWRRDHRRYFERNGGFDREMMLVCERFRLVHDYA